MPAPHPLCAGLRRRHPERARGHATTARPAHGRSIRLGALLLLAILRAGAAEPVLPTITADAPWLDTAGAEILAQGGDVVRVGTRFYWYGVEFADERPVQVRCYSSSDLAAWTCERPVLTAHVARRVKALHQAMSGRCVLVTRAGTTLAVAVAAAPTGPFALAGTCTLPEAAGDGDAALVEDGDAAYVIYDTAVSADGASHDLACAEFDAEHARVGAVIQRFAKAPCGTAALWRRNGVWYCSGAGCGGDGWSAVPTWYCTAPGLRGPWSPWRKLSRSMVAPNQLVGESFGSRHDTVLVIPGAQDTLVVYWGDRWSQVTGYGVGRQVCMPLDFAGEVPGLTWRRPWHPDVAAGTFTDELRRHGLWREPKP